MTPRFFATTNRSNRCAAAATCSASASLCVLLDTVLVWAVSVFVLCLLVLRIMMPIW